jgi:hypothetical protein
MACTSFPRSVSIPLTAFRLSLMRIISEDRKDLRIPKSFAQLQALNFLLKKYRDVYPYRIFICYITVYLLYVIPT